MKVIYHNIAKIVWKLKREYKGVKHRYKNDVWMKVGSDVSRRGMKTSSEAAIVLPRGVASASRHIDDM